MTVIARGSAGRTAGVTLIELVTCLAVIGILAAITVPALAGGPAQISTLRAAQQLGSALRLAQALAEDGECRTRVIVHEQSWFCVERRRSGEWARAESQGFAPVLCTSNYPADGVEFDASGLPLSCATGGPRAGTFTLTRGAAQRSVVVQLTGRVRVK